MNCFIGVVSHKTCRLLSNDPNYHLIRVGPKNDSGSELNDKSGDNISELNDYYCELTALYWMWKNVSAEAYGLVHYRRYFFDYRGGDNEKEGFERDILSTKKVAQLLKPGHIIVPFEAPIQPLSYSRKHQTVTESAMRLISAARESVHCLTPEADRSFSIVLERGYMCFCNMFVMCHKDFDEYCTWIFMVLFDFDKRCTLLGLDRPKRYDGYLAELLFNVWLLTYRKRGHLYFCDKRNIESDAFLDYRATAKGLLFRAFRHTRFLWLLTRKLYVRFSFLFYKRAPHF